METNRILIIGQDVELGSLHGLDEAGVIITFELSDEIELKRKDLPALYFHRYAQSKKVWPAIVETARRWLETWPTKPIRNGQSAIDIFKFEDTSLWWFVFDAMWETKNGIFDTFYRVKALLSLLQDYKPAKIELRGVFDFDIHEILKALTGMFECELMAESYTVKMPAQNDLARPAGKLRLIVRFLLLIAVRAIARKKNKNAVTFFLNHGATAVERDSNGIRIINDHYLEGLEDYMAKDGPNKLLISMNMPTRTSSFAKNLLIEMGRTARGRYMPWLCYFTSADLNERRRLVGHYYREVIDLEGSPGFRESMKVDGIDLYPMLKETFNTHLPRALALVHSELLLAKRFVEEERPRVLFHTAGLSPSGRALSFECRKRNIPIIAPQLGIISPELPVNTAFLITDAFDKRFLPEYLVWGPFYKDLIAGRGYPKSLVKVVGFWRTENAAKQQRPLPEDYILYVAGANLGKLSYILSFDEEISTIKLIQKAIPSGLRLLVKLHPSLPYDVYYRALKDVINKIKLIGGPGTPSIEEFLPSARIVVGKASTVLVQALILNKPVIVTNFGSELNFLGFEGIPFVTTQEEFEASVKDILDHGLQDFNIEHYCSPIGHKSTSLIVSEIEKERK